MSRALSLCLQHFLFQFPNYSPKYTSLSHSHDPLVPYILSYGSLARVLVMTSSSSRNSYILLLQKRFFIMQFCLQFTLLKFSSCVNFKILSTAISFHAFTVGLSKTQQGSEIVHSTFHRTVHPGKFFFLFSRRRTFTEFWLIRILFLFTKLKKIST